MSALLLTSICESAEQTHFDGKTWWRHLEVLASDDMEGRGTGSRGLERAEAYVVEQLKKYGVAPAGTNGYCQPIAFESRQVIETESSAALVPQRANDPRGPGWKPTSFYKRYAAQ